MQNTGVESEKSPFLPNQKPVCLTPSWEEQKLPNDELNFKGLTMARAQMTLEPPKDKYKIVFFIFLIHGLGTLTSWNMFITAKDYFVKYKLANAADYSQYFINCLAFASQIPNVILNWLNLFTKPSGDLTKRIVYSILVQIVIFIVTVVLAMVDTSAWPGVFFWITMLCVVLLNMANGIYQSTVYGIVATLPIKYTGAVVLGSNISGVFTAVISMCSTYLFSSLRTAAIYYFITAMLILLLCFDTYFALPLNRFFRYHETKSKENSAQNTDDQSKNHVPYWTIFKEAFPQLFNVFFTFFVTLSLFPSVHSDIKASDKEFLIEEKHFTSVTCFLTFNLFAMLGNLLTSWVQWPKPKYLVVPVVLRVLFIPLLVFCNYRPPNVERTIPVLINNDWAYWFIALLFSFSSGYLSSLGMMYTPQCVTPKYQLTAGMFAAAVLVTGIFSGVLFAFIFPMLVQVQISY